MFDIDIRRQDVPAVYFMSCEEGEFRLCVSKGIDAWIQKHTHPDAEYRINVIDCRRSGWINIDETSEQFGYDGVLIRAMGSEGIQYSFPLVNLATPAFVAACARTIESLVALMNGMPAPVSLGGMQQQLLYLEGWLVQTRNCGISVIATPLMAQAMTRVPDVISAQVTESLHMVQRIMWPARESSWTHRMIVRTHGGIELHVGNDCACLCSDRVSLHDREVQGWEAASHNFDHAHHMIQALLCLAQLESLARNA